MDINVNQKSKEEIIKHSQQLYDKIKADLIQSNNLHYEYEEDDCKVLIKNKFASKTEPDSKGDYTIAVYNFPEIKFYKDGSITLNNNLSFIHCNDGRNNPPSDNMNYDYDDGYYDSYEENESDIEDEHYEDTIIEDIFVI